MLDWHWAEQVKPKADTPSCQVTHGVGVISNRLRTRLDSGQESWSGLLHSRRVRHDSRSGALLRVDARGLNRDPAQGPIAPAPRRLSPKTQEGRINRAIGSTP